MADAENLHLRYDIGYNDHLTPDTVLAFGVRYMIRLECFGMVLLFVALL